MYKIILTNATNDNQKVVWDVKKDIKLLRSASMQKQEDGIDSVSISPVHNFIENSATFIQPYNTLIEIINEKTNVIEFKGRVLSPESEMTDSGLFTHELIFEGAEAYLKDSIQRYSFEFDKMPVENLKKVIAHHNNELKSEAYKHFKVGNVTVEKNIIPSDENYNEELKYFKRSDDKDTYETLMDLKEKYGGTFIFEPTNDVTLVHWLKETGDLTNTVIKIGKNLKSIQKKFDASEVITRLKPLGASSETANGDEIKLTIAEVNNGSPYIDIPQLIKLFGIQTGTVTFDDKHTPETLKKAAEDWIKEHEKKQARISLSLDALDLSYLKLDPDEFKIYNKHRVICPPLNIDEDLKIISIKVDLLKPYDKEVSFGERELGYAELEKERSIKNTNLIINKTVPGIIDRQTGGINRDVMVLNDYKITFEDLKLHQSSLLDEVNQILNSEYLVDDEVRADLLLKAQNVESLSNTIKDALESADERTINATKLVDIQNKMNAYRSALKSFVIAKEGAKISLLKRLQILQSQYTEKKFSDTLKSVAEKFGLTVNQYNELIGEPNVVQKAISVVTEQTDIKLANYVKSQDYETDKNGIVERLNNSDSERQQLSNQIADRVTLTEYKNMKVGTRNLLANTNYTNTINHWYATTQVIEGNPKSLFVKSNGSRVNYGFITDKTTNIESGKEYTFKLDLKTSSIASLTYIYYMPVSGASYKENAMNINTVIADGEWHTYSVTFTATTSMSNVGLLIGASHGDGFELRKAMLVEGNRAGDYQEAPEDTDQKLTTMKTEIIQDGRKYSQEVSQQIYNASSKTLNQIVSKYINDTSTGHQFTYDENGNISSFVVGNGGIKIDGDKVNITANKEFTAMVNALSNKADETNIINKINLSREGLDINVNNIGIRGGDNTNYLTIKNQEILSRGIFTRTWGGVTDTPTATVGIKDGYILSRNQKTGYSLYMTEKGLSTMMAGGVGTEQAGALEFHYDLMNDNSRGVRLSSTYGVVFLHSENSRIYTRSRYTTNIESWESSIYLRPQVNSRTGVNEFSFYVKDNDSAGATDGTILFGEISNEKGLAGSGIRFKKGAIRGQTESIVYATDNQGNVGTGSFYADNLYGNLKAKTTNQYALVASDGEFRVTDKNGASGSTINYRDIRIGGLITYNGFMNHSGANVYFGVGSKELRITNNNHYNGGDTTYRAISAADFIKASKAEFKKDIEEWNYDALTVLMEELQLYSYKYKNDDRGIIHHGAVIGDGYDMPSEFRTGDGINTNEMLSWSLRAIQQLGQKIKILEDKLNEQKS